MGALAGMILAHGGIPGLIGETGAVFVGLAVFGYFLHRSAKKEREQTAAKSSRAERRRRR